MHPWSLKFSDEAFEARHTTGAFRASYQVSTTYDLRCFTCPLAHLPLTHVLPYLLLTNLSHLVPRTSRTKRSASPSWPCSLCSVP